MSEVDRRTFIKRSAAGAAGAAAIGALGAGPAAAATRPASGAGDDSEPETASGDTVVAYLRPGTGEVRVMVGDREVVRRDPDLARRIRRAAK
jgi:anaerobic selenocysteine-containing dehydrogenase